MVDAVTLDVRCDQESPRHAATRDGEIAAIHQPNYVPWLGYFSKMARAHTFVFLDNVEFSNGKSFVNRNAIKSAKGPLWLTVPVLRTGRSGQLISEAEIDGKTRWASQHLNSLRSNYGGSPFFREVYALLEPYYLGAAESSLRVADFNIHMIQAIAEFLGLKTKFVRASELVVRGDKTELLTNICRAVDARVYIGRANWMSEHDDALFAKNGIRVLPAPLVQETYPQRFGPFAPNLSILDALMNCGAEGTRRLLG